MKKHQHMEHDDPNAKRLTPFTEGEIVWKFTRRGTLGLPASFRGITTPRWLGTIDVK